MTEQQTPASVVERLNAMAADFRDQTIRLGSDGPTSDMLTEAAALIERLSAERERLREAVAEVVAHLEAIARVHGQTGLETAHDAKEWAHCAAVVALGGHKFTLARAALTQGESRQTGAMESGAENTGPVQYVSVRFGDIQVNAPMPGFRHHHILTVASYFGHRHGEQGFAKADGTFLTRKAAAILALASGQVTKLIAGPDLYSEDIW
jgi:hypothetical protein